MTLLFVSVTYATEPAHLHGSVSDKVTDNIGDLFLLYFYSAATYQEDRNELGMPAIL